MPWEGKKDMKCHPLPDIQRPFSTQLAWWGLQPSHLCMGFGGACSHQPARPSLPEECSHYVFLLCFWQIVAFGIPRVGNLWVAKSWSKSYFFPHRDQLQSDEVFQGHGLLFSCCLINQPFLWIEKKSRNSQGWCWNSLTIPNPASTAIWKQTSHSEVRMTCHKIISWQNCCLLASPKILTLISTAPSLELMLRQAVSCSLLSKHTQIGVSLDFWFYI